MRREKLVSMLEKELENLIQAMSTKTWTFHKFGTGGPYRVLLQKLKRLSITYDREIMLRFPMEKHPLFFNDLIVLGISLESRQTAIQKNLSYKLKLMHKILQ